MGRARDFNVIDSIYNKNYQSSLYELGKSPFLPTPRKYVFDAFKFLIEEKIITETDTFVDLGSGAGDVCAISAYVYGVNSIGIEFDQQLVDFSEEMSEKITKTLQKDDFTTPKYYCGDFTDISLLDIEIDDVSLVYNYLSSDLVSVLDQFRKGTYFLNYLFTDKSKIGLRSDKASITWQYLNNDNIGHLNRNIRGSIVQEAKEKISDWKYILTIPNTKFSLFQKKYNDI